jgi:O-antigen/teichoic acid export membrane protein
VRRPWAVLARLLPSLGSKVREVAAALTYEVVYLVSLVVVFPLTIRGLGTAQYGEYATIYVIAGIAMVWVYAGANGAVAQLLLQMHRNTRSVLGLARRQVLLAAAPAAIVGLGATWWLLGIDLWPAALVIFCGDLLVLGIAEVQLASVFSHLGVAAATRVRIVAPIFKAVAVAALSAFGALSLMSLVIVNFATSATLLTLSWLAVRAMLRDLNESGEPTTRRELFRLSALYSTSMSTNAAQGEGEKFVLAAFRPTTEVGEYQAAYRIVSTALVPFRAVQTAAIRWFLPNDDGGSGQVRRAAVLSGASAIYGAACAVGIIVFEPVIRAVLGPEFEGAVTMTKWLSLVPLFHGLAEVPLLGLLGLGRNRARTLLGVATAALAIVAYLLLIPSMGWEGAVLGTYLSEMAMIVAGWALLIRFQRQSDELRADEGESSAV